jgi:class 3 adenylate cyclase
MCENKNPIKLTKFAGDSMLVTWPAPPEDPEELAQSCGRAATCAADMIRNLSNFKVVLADFLYSTVNQLPEDEREVNLTIHLSLGAGPVYHVHIGDKGRRDYFISGEALSQAAELLDVAKGGARGNSPFPSYCQRGNQG